MSKAAKPEKPKTPPTYDFIHPTELDKGMVIVEEVDSHGFPKSSIKVSTAVMIDKSIGSCRGVHVNKDKCFDPFIKVRVIK